MEEEFNNVIYRTREKLVEVFHYINEYELVYNQETLGLFEEIDSQFLNDLYWLYWNFVTIRICALLDKKETFGRKNLTVLYLIGLIRKLNFKCLPLIEQKLTKINKKLVPFKNARNKAFGHFDLDFIISKESSKIELDDLIEICQLIGEILNLVDIERGKPMSIYGVRSERGAMRLLPILKLGVEANRKNADK